MSPVATVGNQVARIAAPYLFAAAGGLVAERAGVISLGLEGYMLGGACGAAFGALATNGAVGGIVTGLLAGVLLGLLHATVTVRFRGDQIISGLAINLLAIGATQFALRVAFGSASNSPRTPGIAGSLADPFSLAALAALPILAVVVYATPFGLHVRAAGETPDAATAAGIRVPRVQLIAVVLSGSLAAVGGAYLALDQHQFTDQMTAGRGFIALAAVIFGGWRPFPTALACLLFAGAETFEIQVAGRSAIPSQLIGTLPYIITILALGVNRFRVQARNLSR